MSNQTSIPVKICGLKTAEDVETAVEAGASFVGFLRFPQSPRYIEPGAARDLAARLPAAVKSVALLVDPSDAEVIEAATWADMIQLHGSETPRRTRALKALAGKPVIKALALADAKDLEQAALYQDVADILLFDAKPPTSGPALPGGNGLAFDWQILAGATLKTPWMLSGGLDAQNVKEAIHLTRAKMVDVSSGVEVRRGVKSPKKIKAFLKAVEEMSTQ